MTLSTNALRAHTDRPLIVVGFNKLPENVVAVIEEDDFVRFLVKDRHIQNYGKSVENQLAYKPLVGELIMAKMDDTSRWYRCLFAEVVSNYEGGTYGRVYALDWGFSQIVHLNDIRVSR